MFHVTVLNNLLIYLFLTMLGLHCCEGFFFLVLTSETSCHVRPSHCSGFSCSEHRFWDAWTSIAGDHRLGSDGSQALEHRLNSCGTQPQLLRGMWDLSGPVVEPRSPVLAGRLFTTEPPGKTPYPFQYIVFWTLEPERPRSGTPPPPPSWSPAVSPLQCV